MIDDWLMIDWWFTDDGFMIAENLADIHIWKMARYAYPHVNWTLKSIYLINIIPFFKEWCECV